MKFLFERLLDPSPNGPEMAIALAGQLNVKVSASSLKKEIEEHPDYPGLLSISDVLHHYGIDNITASFDPDKLQEIPTPFIAQIKGEKSGQRFFTLVRSTDAGEVSFLDPVKHHWASASIEKFRKMWSGIVLLAEAGEIAGEKEYVQTSEEAARTKQARYLAIFGIPFILLIAGVATVVQSGLTSLLPLLFTLLFFAGSVVGVLLLWYEFDQYNPLLRQICSAGHKVNCSAVLQSRAAKVLGVSWSAIGFNYFAGGLLLLLSSGITGANALSLLTWLNTMAVPYVFFSIYYQWRVAKQWCGLCLSVQAILLLQLTTALIAGWHHLLPAGITSPAFITQAVTAFALPFIAATLILPVLRTLKGHKKTKRELQRLKLSPLVFEAMLKKQKTIHADTTGLGIVLGNPNATQKIIKVCNPYCGPCARAHVSMEELLKHNPDLQLQIIFTATNEEGDIKAPPVSHLLSISEKQDEKLTRQALDDWYLQENKNYDDFASRYPVNGELKMQSPKIAAMAEWCDKTDITATPTIFINGFQLPKIYNVDDLRYLLST